MINDIFTFLNRLLSGNYAIAICASFGWGILIILLSPCHLSSIPLIIGFINSRGTISVKRTFRMSLFFSFGILISIALIGAITASLGMMLGNLGAGGNYFVAVIFLIVGLYLLDLIKLPGWQSSAGKNIKSSDKIGIMQAFTIGLLFGIGLGPCTFAFMAPVLGIVFGIASASMFYAVVLLLAFAIGHCSVIVVAGTLTTKVQKYMNWTEDSKAISYIRKICGLLVISGGAYFIYTAY